MAYAIQMIGNPMALCGRPFIANVAPAGLSGALMRIRRQAEPGAAGELVAEVSAMALPARLVEHGKIGRLSAAFDVKTADASLWATLGVEWLPDEEALEADKPAA